MRSHKVIASGLAVVAIVAIGVLGFIGLIMTKPVPKKVPLIDRSLLVEVMEARKASVAMNVVEQGRARAKTELLLIAQVSGRAVFLAPNLRVGEMIERDALLLRIDPRPYQLAADRSAALLQSAKVRLESLIQEKKNAEASRELARKEVDLGQRAQERASLLLKEKSGSEAALDLAQETFLGKRTRLLLIENQLALWPQQYAMAEAALKQQEAHLAEAQLQLEYTEIRSPFDGRVVERLVEEGQFVAAGTAVARVYDASVMEIPVRVALEDFAWIDTASLLQGDSARRPKAAARLVRDGQVVWRWRGEVARVEGQIDAATHTAGLIIEVAAEAILGFSSGTVTSRAEGSGGPSTHLLPGLFVEVEIEGATVEDIISVPLDALDERGNVRLYKEGKLLIRPVRVLRVNREGIAYVDKYLEEGDLVILSSIATPVSGMLLRLALPSTEGSEDDPS